MSELKLKIKPEPDFNRLMNVLLRNKLPDRVPFFELFSNIEDQVLKAIGKYNNGKSGMDEDVLSLQRHIDYMFHLGYDYVDLHPKNFEFPQKKLPKTRTDFGDREYYTAAFNTIADRNDFEKYLWPDPGKIDYSDFEMAEKMMPSGMKVIARGGGVLEYVMWLLGYEGTCMLLYEDQQLLRDMFDAVGSRIEAYYDAVSSMDMVGAVLMGDDMGFKTQTMLSPEVYREYLFPWHRKIVQAAHRHSKPIILHACGNLSEIMEDIIGCGWDAKHSFEDTIEPIWELKKKYGARISLLGGFDMDKISRMSVEEVRSHTRFMLGKCAPDGGWALGTGNSVADYVPAENLLAMLEEGFCYK